MGRSRPLLLVAGIVIHPKGNLDNRDVDSYWDRDGPQAGVKPPLCHGSRAAGCRIQAGKAFLYNDEGAALDCPAFPSDG